VGDAPPLAADREQMDGVAVEQLELTHGAPDKLRIRVMTASITPIS
jgi:hypothetical protein